MAHAHRDARPPEPDRKAGPAYAKLFLDGLADDETLTPTEKLLLSVLLNHQRMSGGGWTLIGYKRLAKELGMHHGSVRRVVRDLGRKYDAGGTSWRVLVTYRTLRCNLFKVRIPPDVLARWRETAAQQSDPPRPPAYPPPAPLRPPGANGGPAGAGATPPYAPARTPPARPRVDPPARRRAPIRTIQKELEQEGSGEGVRGLFDRDPSPVNLFAAAGGGDVADALRGLVEAGHVLFVQWEGLWRVLNRVESNAQGVILFLASEEEADRCEAVRLHPRQLGSLRFGR